MKYLKKFNINEKVGVPTGITELSKNLYNSIIERLNNGNLNFKDDDDELEFRFNQELEGKINDFEIKSFNIEIKIYKSDDDESVLTGAYFRPNHKIDRKNFKMEYLNNGEISLGIRMSFPNWKNSEKEFWLDKVKNLLTSERGQVISSLGHELMHSYDLTFIKGGKTFIDISKYSAITNLRFGIPVIDKFFYYLYFISKTECIVRSSEIASKMEAQGVTQEQFLEFIQNNKTWKYLKEISEWSYQKFNEDLLSQIDRIKGALEHNDIEIDGLSDKEVVDLVKDLIINNIIGSKLDSLSDLLRDPKYISDPFLALLTGKKPEEDPDLDIKEDFYKTFLEKLKKDIKNSDYYFNSKEKMFKFESNKLLKKLSKLFSMAKDTKTNKLHSKISNKISRKTESILNWEKYLDAIGVKAKISNRKFL